MYVVVEDDDNDDDDDGGGGFGARPPLQRLPTIGLDSKYSLFLRFRANIPRSNKFSSTTHTHTSMFDRCANICLKNNLLLIDNNVFDRSEANSGHNLVGSAHVLNVLKKHA